MVRSAQRSSERAGTIRSTVIFVLAAARQVARAVDESRASLAPQVKPLDPAGAEAHSGCSAEARATIMDPARPACVPPLKATTVYVYGLPRSRDPACP